MASRMLTVDDQDPRKSQQTRPVRSAERTRVKRISWIESSMNVVVSKFSVELQALRQLGLQDGHPRLDVAPHLDGVGAAQLRDAEADRRLPHGAHEPAAVLEAVLHDGHVLQADGRAAA